MKISKLESALILTEALVELGPHAHEKEIYDEVYAFLDYAEEQAAESEELDEETEYELTPARTNFADELARFDAEEFDYPYDYSPSQRPVNVFGDPEPTEAFSAAIEDEFSDFSPSVGTFEGTAELAKMVGREHAKSELIDLIGAYKNVMQQAPVAERVHVPFNAAKTIGEAFQPCGAALPNTDHDY